MSACVNINKEWNSRHTIVQWTADANGPSNPTVPIRRVYFGILPVDNFSVFVLALQSSCSHKSRIRSDLGAAKRDFSRCLGEACLQK